jgi:hypothetical protein
MSDWLMIKEREYEHVEPDVTEDFDPAALDALLQSYNYRIRVQQEGEENQVQGHESSED